MTSYTFNESEYEAFQIESARDVVSCSFIVQRSLTPLDLNACEYMLMRRSVFTEEGYRKMCQPSRWSLYTLHLDLPRDMERSLRIAVPYESNRYRTFHLGVASVSEWVYNRDLAPVIVNDIKLANNKMEKLRRYLNVMKLLKLDRHRITSNFIFDSIIHVLFPDCLDSNLVVEFAVTFSFYSWIFYRESPDIVGYVLEHARRIRYNIWASLEYPINACIIFHTTGNIGKLLEYGTVLRTKCCVYMEMLEFLEVRRIVRRSISERRIFLLIQLLYVFTYNRTSWAELRCIWRSIPDPYLSGKEIYFAFGRVVTSTYFYDLIEYYNSAIVEEYIQIENAAPRSLRHLSRVAVRNILSSNFQLPHGISQLGLGHILESFLKLEC
ncbi:hypothetical protein AVEN_97584-1 [Araneus ventricosus]|uniref:SOCS box domain-containing protein n=1 Tax=Araneus ventricosus TaxID=182803 RepID=A0A4Y2F3V5_ARAVE|nr:hypothetical protein AVEN_97584-1 [Araneus ventricosus]